MRKLTLILLIIILVALGIGYAQKLYRGLTTETAPLTR